MVESEWISARLKSHQTDAVSKLRDGNILRGGVGTGKSRVAAAYYLKNHSTLNVVVITTARKRDSHDWMGEFAHFGVGMDKDSTVAGVLVVDSWNNIHKYEQLQDTFFVFDEQRLVGSGGWVRSFLRISRNNPWILLTATPGDSWLDYIPVFVANGFYKNRTEFKARHVVYRSHSKFPVVEKYLETGRLIKLRNSILVNMPYPRHTKRHTVLLPCGYDEDLMNLVTKKRWNPYKDKPIKNSGELFYLMRKVVGTSPDRLEVLRKTMEKHPRLIVFYNFDRELELLRTIEGIEIAEWNSHKHQHCPTSDRWLYLVQYTSGAEAWNCITTNATFFWSQNPSYKLTEQSYGRIDRMNTPFVDLFYYVPLSKTWIDRRLRQCFEDKKDFNMSDLESV